MSYERESHHSLENIVLFVCGGFIVWIVWKVIIQPLFRIGAKHD